MPRNLSDLTEPLGDEEFLKRFERKEFLYIRSDRPDRFQYLLPWATLNALLDQNSLPPERVRIVRDGRELARAFYREPDNAAYLDPQRLRTILAQGASLVINRIEELIPEIRRLAHRLELILRERIQVNAYCTMGRGGAFKAHYDAHDVIVLQIFGVKRWEFLDDPEIFPLEEQKREPLPAVPRPRNVVHEALMEPGDVLFLPRGLYHRAQVQDAMSVHLTVGIHTRKGTDFSSWFNGLLKAEPLFRQDVPLLSGREVVAEHEARLKARMIELLGQTSLQAFVDSTDAKRKPVCHFQFGPKSEVRDDDRIELLARRRVPPAGTGEGGSERRDLSPAACSVLEFLWGPVAVRFGALRDAFNGRLAPDALGAALDELVAHGLVAVSPPAPAPDADREPR